MEILDDPEAHTHLEATAWIEPDTDAATREEYELDVLEIEAELEQRIGTALEEATSDGLLANGNRIEVTFWVGRSDVPDTSSDSSSEENND
jgi:hypothetical protein